MGSNIEINIPAWYGHEYCNAVKLLRAMLEGKDGAEAISAIKKEIDEHHPQWNRQLLQHTEAVIVKLENMRS